MLVVWMELHDCDLEWKTELFFFLVYRKGIGNGTQETLPHGKMTRRGSPEREGQDAALLQSMSMKLLYVSVVG